MCFSAPKPPPMPPAVQLPPAPAMANVSAPTIKQAGPASPTVMENPTLRRKGKRGLTIPLTTAPGTNIPGM